MRRFEGVLTFPCLVLGYELWLWLRFEGAGYSPQEPWTLLFTL
jgi:hypothetical protein